MTQLLRILTGIHAGAQVALTPGTHRVGADEDVDIRLDDWSEAQALLHVTNTAEGAVVQLERQMEGAAQGTVCALTPLMAMQVGQIVLCVGPQAGPWPSDVALLARLFRPSVHSRTTPRSGHRPVHRMVALGLAGVCAAVGVAMAMPATPRARHPVMAATAANTPAQDTRARLVRIRVAGLQVQRVGGSVVVSGMVRDEAGNLAVRAALADVPGVVLRYGVAQVQARAIEEALGMPGAQVIYSGDGVFAVQGQVHDLPALTEALQRVRRDLDANVRGLENHATTVTAEVAIPAFTEAVASGRVQYMQTPDGVKHIYAQGAVASPDTASSAAAPTRVQPQEPG